MMPETGFISYFENLLKTRFSEKEDEIISLILSHPEIDREPIEEKVMACFRLTNPFHEVIEATITLKCLAVSVISKKVTSVLLPA